MIRISSVQKTLSGTTITSSDLATGVISLTFYRSDYQPPDGVRWPLTSGLILNSLPSGGTTLGTPSPPSPTPTPSPVLSSFSIDTSGLKLNYTSTVVLSAAVGTISIAGVSSALTFSSSGQFNIAQVKQGDVVTVSVTGTTPSGFTVTNASVTNNSTFTSATPTPTPSPVLSSFAIDTSGLKLNYTSTVVLTAAVGTVSIAGVSSALTFSSSGQFNIAQVKQGDVVTVSLTSTTPTGFTVTNASVVNNSTFTSATPPPTPTPAPVANLPQRLREYPVKTENTFNASKQKISTKTTYTDGVIYYDVFTYPTLTDVDYGLATWNVSAPGSPTPSPPTPPVLSSFAIDTTGLKLNYTSTVTLTAAVGTVTIAGVSSALTFNGSGQFNIAQVKQGDVVTVSITGTTPSGFTVTNASVVNNSTYIPPTPPVLSSFSIDTSGLFLNYTSTATLTAAVGTISIGGVSSALIFNSSGQFRVSQVKQGDVVTVSITSTTPSGFTVTSASVVNNSTYVSPPPTPSPVVGISNDLLTSGSCPVRTDEYLNGYKQIINTVDIYSDLSKIYGAFTYATTDSKNFTTAIYTLT